MNSRASNFGGMASLDLSKIPPASNCAGGPAHRDSSKKPRSPSDLEPTGSPAAKRPPKETGAKPEPPLSPFTRGMTAYAPRKFFEVVSLAPGKKPVWKSDPNSQKISSRQMMNISWDTERFLGAHARLDPQRAAELLKATLEKKSMVSVKYALLSMFEEESEETKMIDGAVKFLAHHDSKGTRAKEEQDAVDAVLVALSFGENCSSKMIAERVGMGIKAVGICKRRANEMISSG
jgi:hypothetical protein